jgi:siderophore synthetase component
MQTPVDPIFVALEHIEARGSLLLFAPDHAQRVQLMKVMAEIELVAWNAMAKKYELTPLGRQRLAEYRGTTHAQVAG